MSREFRLFLDWQEWGKSQQKGRGLCRSVHATIGDCQPSYFFSVFLSSYFGVLEHIKDESKAFESRDMYDDEDHICGDDFNQIHLTTGAD